MVSVLKVSALSSVLLGVILIAAKVDDTYDLGIIPYAMIIIGICVLIVLALAGNRQQNLLCPTCIISCKLGTKVTARFCSSTGVNDAGWRRK